jgi:hypothetical protein
LSGRINSVCNSKDGFPIFGSGFCHEKHKHKKSFCFLPRKKKNAFVIHRKFLWSRLKQAVPSYAQGCQMVCLQTKNPTLGNFGDVGIFYGPFYGLLLYFMDIWYVQCVVYFSHFGILHQEKSGNPGSAIFNKSCFSSVID